MTIRSTRAKRNAATSAKARIARQRAALAPLLTAAAAQAWAASTEKFCFCVDICDAADVPHSVHWRWVETRLAALAA